MPRVHQVQRIMSDAPSQKLGSSRSARCAANCSLTVATGNRRVCFNQAGCDERRSFRQNFPAEEYEAPVHMKGCALYSRRSPSPPVTSRIAPGTRLLHARLPDTRPPGMPGVNFNIDNIPGLRPDTRLLLARLLDTLPPPVAFTEGVVHPSINSVLAGCQEGILMWRRCCNHLRLPAIV